MRATLDALKDYQEVLSRIAELEELLAFIPPEIVNLENEWKGIQVRITELSEKKEGLETKLKELKTELEEVNVKHQKFEKDLHEVTNNKEYHAVLKEIDTAKKKIHTLSEDISERSKELDEINNNLEECKGLEKESQKKFQDEKADHDSKLVESRSERDKLAKSKTGLAKKIPAQQMRQFERIASRRNGVGLALCISAICQACNVRVRQNVVDQLRVANRIITCESCKRILYFADEG